MKTHTKVGLCVPIEIGKMKDRYKSKSFFCNPELIIQYVFYKKDYNFSRWFSDSGVDSEVSSKNKKLII